MSCDRTRGKEKDFFWGRFHLDVREKNHHHESN